MPSLLLRNGTLVTMNAAREVFEGDLFIREDRIVAVGRVPEGETSDTVIDAAGCAVIPGLVQSHLHLCQTLFRNQADDLPLLPWLRECIWPMEGAHDEESLRLSARLGIAELVRGGTTAILDMGTVHHTGALFDELERSGLRATGGKVMMDREEDVPPGLRESTRESLDESLRLCGEWHGRAGGRIRYAFAPRFAVSCTAELLREVGKLSADHNIPVHSHASENPDEVALVQELHGRRNVHVFRDLGLMDHHLCLAHCIHVDAAELEDLANPRVHVLHCPSSNLKLGSGIAPVPDFLARGIRVSLGADGAPCNNNLDAFMEMRLAALIQKPRHGAGVFPAERVFEMATLGGALALGLADEIGSLEVGKKADVAVVRLDQPHSVPGGNLYGQLVYSAGQADVTHTIVDGRLLFADGYWPTLEVEADVRAVPRVLEALLLRAGLR